MEIIFEGYKSRYYTPMVDTGAQTTIMKENCLPEWKTLRTPFRINGFNNNSSKITLYQTNVKIQIWDKILLIPKVYCFELIGKDIILGTNFLNQYKPFSIDKEFQQSYTHRRYFTSNYGSR